MQSSIGLLLALAWQVRRLIQVAHRLRVAIAQPLVIKNGAEEGEVAGLSYEQARLRPAQRAFALVHAHSEEEYVTSTRPRLACRSWRASTTDT